MKRVYLVWFIVMLTFVTLFARKPFRNEIKTAAGETTWNILADTTVYSYSNYLLMDISRVNFWAADTSGDDSLALTIALQAKGPVGWFTVKSLSVTTDSTSDDWLVTNTAVGFSDSMRYAVTGGAANSKDSPVLLKMDFVGKDYDY